MRNTTQRWLLLFAAAIVASGGCNRGVVLAYVDGSVNAMDSDAGIDASRNDGGADSKVNADSVDASVNGGPLDASVGDGSASAAVPDGSPLGSVPAGLPRRLLVGLYAEHGNTWMTASGVPWDARVRFFTKGWASNFGFAPSDGEWARAYMDEAAAHSQVPVLGYRVLLGAGGGDALGRVQNVSAMAEYFADFKLLMQKAAEFGKPVVVLVENAEFAHLEAAARHDPSVAAAVASSGLPELKDLPNTLAGWGQAFLILRKSTGATNVKLAMDIVGWGSELDVLNHDSSVPLQPEVDRMWAFLAPLGLQTNPTGETYDLLSHHLADADFAYYVKSPDGWWNPSDAASTNTLSFNRWVEWLSLWNQRTARRWVLWEIPVGNTNQVNQDNTGQPSGGYRDNRVEWIFGPSGAAHRNALVRAGVSVMLFGLANSTQASVVNDGYTDGQLFMQTRAGAFLAAGGLALP